MKSKKLNSQLKGSYPQRITRTFNRDLKIKKVKEIEMGLTTVLEVSRDLEVSYQSVYRWIKLYSLTYQSPIQVKVEPKSLTKQVSKLKEELRLSHEMVGQKEFEIDLLYKVLSLIGEDYGIDIDEKYYKKKPFCHGLRKTNQSDIKKKTVTK